VNNVNELDKQLSEYIATIKQKNEKETKQVLSHKLMDGSTPERLLYHVFFYNATILGL